MMGRLIAFAALSAIVVVTPGPDSLLVLRNTLRAGRRNGIRTACGAAAGLFCDLLHEAAGGAGNGDGHGRLASWVWSAG